jgi:hypothetical protein
MLNITFGAVGAGAGARAGAGAALRYCSGSSSTKMMRLLAAPVPQHWFTVIYISLQLPPKFCFRRYFHYVKTGTLNYAGFSQNGVHCLSYKMVILNWKDVPNDTQT